jgi:uncharacterized membrane protein
MSTDVGNFLAWYLTAAAAGLLALPVTFRLFRHLPDRGYPLARSAGLLLIGYLFWLLGSLGFVRNDAAGLLLAAALVGGLGVVWLRGEGLRALGRWLRASQGLVLAVEALFLAAFALMAYVRAHNPNIEGTEKPMEFMFVNAILRSPTFPPQDAWLAGHAISYYYFGYVLVAALARLTATDSAVAFNLALAMLFALTAIGSLSVVMNLIALARGHGKVEDSALTPGPSPAGRGESDATAAPPITNYQLLVTSFFPALLAPLLLLVVGNFYGLLQFAYQNGIAAEARVPAVLYYFGAADPANQGNTANPTAPLASTPGVRAGWVNLWDWLDLKETQEPAPRPAEWRWDTGGMWFYAARVLHDKNLLGSEVEAIDENPAFSFLLGDMHPHVLALPFVVVATALALEWLLWASGGARPQPASTLATSDPEDTLVLDSASRRLSSIVQRLLLSALLLGGLSFLNTWDFPIYLFLTVLALALGYGRAHGREALVGALPRLGVLALVLGGLSVLLYFPFYVTFQSQAGGLLPNLIWPTRFQQSFVFFGPVLIGVVIYLLWLATRGRARLDWRAAGWAALGLVVALVLASVVLGLLAAFSPSLRGYVDNAIAPLSRPEALQLLVQRRLVDSLATLVPAAIIGAAVGLAWGWLQPPRTTEPPEPVDATPFRPWRRARPASETDFDDAAAPGSPAVLMVLAMIVTGGLLMLGPEYLYLRDNFGLRMNTLFKFYFQTWTLWALAAAFGAWHLARYAGPVLRSVAAGALWLSIAGGLVTTTTSLWSKTGGFGGQPTLDGMAWFATRYPNDWAAIQWLRANATGRPVILEAVGGAYNIEEGRVSMATGLPTLMGWTNHEGQWRGDYYSQVAARPEDVQVVYQARDWSATLSVLNQYGVEYVIVGAEERAKYNPVFFPKFDQFMDPVFETGDMTIYQRKPLQAQ